MLTHTPHYINSKTNTIELMKQLINALLKAQVESSGTYFEID
ncbi:MAG: hypothetical protein PV340_04540 [Wolbachia sp.]|nr:hypothetical protein [Wolbachia sp.]